MQKARESEIPTEAELLGRIAQQDAEAFSCFYDRTAPVLFAVAKSILRDDALAEDVLQDVYVQIWEKAAVFDLNLGKPMSWAIALTRNRSLDKLRANKRKDEGMKRFEMEISAAGFLPHAAQSANDKDHSTLILEAMKLLNGKQRQAIELAFFKGLPHIEVAEAMQQPLGTVKAWIRRGLLQLRDELAGKT